MDRSPEEGWDVGQGVIPLFLATFQTPAPVPFVSAETWGSVFDGPNRTAADQERAWRPVLDRLRAWVRTAPAGADQFQVLAYDRMAQAGFYRGATGEDLAWTATPVPTGEGRTFVFNLTVSKRVGPGLLPTRSAYAVVEPGRSGLVPLVPASLGRAYQLSAARRGLLLAVAGGAFLGYEGAPRPFAAVFRLRGGRWRTVARRDGPPAGGLAPFQVLAAVSAGGVPVFSFQRQVGTAPGFRTVETWRLRGAAIHTVTQPKVRTGSAS